MIKSVLVTLGIDIGKFVSGLNTARSNFNSFTGSIGSGINEAVTFLGHLGDAVELAMTAINGLINAAKGLFDTFVSGVAAQQRLTTQLGILMGSAGQAKDFLNGVADANLRLGFVTDEMAPSINKAATALKGLNGAVDPGQLNKFVDLMRRIKAARPDLDFDTIANGLINGMRGNLDGLAKTLGVGIDEIIGLSAKSKSIIAQMQTAGETQLGAVTKVGAGVKAKTEDVLGLLDEALGKIGMGEDAVNEYGNTWDAQVGRLQEIWDGFKESVGEPILEVLIDELKKLGDWLVAHKEEIKEFAEKIGHLTAEGLKNAIEALMKVDWDKVMKGAEGLVEIFAKIDWAAIGDAIDKISSFSLGGNKSPAAAGEGAANDLKKTLGLSQDWTIFDLFKGSNSQAFTATPGSMTQKVEVTVKVDDDGKIKAVAQQAAAQTVNDVVDSATKGSAATSKRQTE